MTATMNRQGQIVLRTTTRQKSPLKSGDLLIVIHDQPGRIILQKRSLALPRPRAHKGYLTPRPLSPATLNRIYDQPNPIQDKIEAEAVMLGHRALAGKKLADL